MKRIAFAILGVLLLTSRPLSAHHGFANFDRFHPVTIEGTLIGMVWANPHVVMTVRTTDATVYSVTWQATIPALSLTGITKMTFNIGDDLIITAAPSRNPTSHELGSVQAVRRPSDGWTWRADTN